jgi:hypothetical protein
MSTTNHQISLQQAIDMTTRFRANRPANFPVCETFELSAVQQLLAANGCTYLRIYLGMKENNEVDVILVAADADGADILPAADATSSALTTGDPTLLEDGYRCPPNCPKLSPLNS